MRKLLKIKPERVTGIVALCYLVLIPAAGAFLWNRHKMLEHEVEDMFMRMQENTSYDGPWRER